MNNIWEKSLDEFACILLPFEEYLIIGHYSLKSNGFRYISSTISILIPKILDLINIILKTIIILIKIISIVKRNLNNRIISEQTRLFKTTKELNLPEINFIGHSLGGSSAQIATLYMMSLLIHERIFDKFKINCHASASPRVMEYKAYLIMKLYNNIDIFHVINGKENSDNTVTIDPFPSFAIYNFSETPIRYLITNNGISFLKENIKIRLNKSNIKYLKQLSVHHHLYTFYDKFKNVLNKLENCQATLLKTIK